MTGFRDVDIFITPDVNYIPSGVGFPAIGIKDGKIDRKELVGGVLDLKPNILIIPFVKIFPASESIIGGSGFYGVLDVASDIHDVLDENKLGLSWVEDAFCATEKASEMFGNDREGLQRKIITYTYEIRRDR